MVKSTDRFEAIKKYELAIQCFELRKTGLNEHEIAEHLEISVGDVRAAVADVIKDKKMIAADLAAEQREIIMNRIDALIAVHWDRAMNGDFYATDRITRLNEQMITISGAKVDKVDVTSGGKNLGEITGEGIMKAVDEARKQIEEWERSRAVDEE